MHENLFAQCSWTSNNKALFTSKKIYKIEIVALSFVFDKYYPIID